MSLINFSGIASGIDSSSLIKALIEQERAARIKPLEDKITNLKDNSSAFQELKDLLNTLKSAASNFRTINGGVLKKTSSSSDETVLSANASNSAKNGTYTVTVSQLAKNGSLSFDSLASSYTSSDSVINSSINDAAPAADRTVTIEIGQGDQKETIDIELTSTTTLNDFVAQFNNSSTKGSASLVNVGTSASPDYRLLINGSNQGTEKGEITVNVGSEITSAGSGAFNNNTLSQATNAIFSISGIGPLDGDDITRSTNSISDVIPGLTLELKDLGVVDITIRDDSAATSSSMQEFVDAYNDVVKFIAENDLVTSEQNGEETTNIFGALASSTLDENVISALRNAFSSSSISGRTVNTLSDLGISTQRDGTLKFDSTVFEQAISDDPEAVRLITQNLGDTLANTSGTIDQFVRFNGLIDQLVGSNDSQVSSYQTRISEQEASLARYEQTLMSQYARLESLIGKLNSQQSALSSILPQT